MTPYRIAYMAMLYNSSRYGRKYPDSTLVYSKRWIRGVWTMGNNYRNKSKLYGAYPPEYLDRITTFVPYRSSLHLFAGSLPATDQYDRFGNVLVPCAPNGIFGGNDKEGDAHQLSSFYPADSYTEIYADPPYSEADAKKYGTKMVNRRKVLYECYEIMKPGGILVWLDTVLPMFRKDMWHWFGSIGIIRSSNHRVRFTFLFERI